MGCIKDSNIPNETGCHARVIAFHLEKYALHEFRALTEMM
jgi:hypothetical protein